MAVALDQFVKRLEDSGIIAPGKLEAFVPPKANPKSAEELAQQLVQSKHLTKYQAQEIYANRVKSLILGNYTILDKIGAGGMGQVFKAEHRRMERIVAIKMLPPAMTKDAAAVARFHREVKAAAKLRHTNIVAADDADEANGVHFLVMEYVEGQDLSALVKKNGPFPVAKAVNIILQAARGLEFAHGEGVVHRDIKPANLLVDKKGVVKILDMGLARIEADGNAATASELTGSGMVMGTVDYMAPEQAMSTKNADARADIYSLGCSLFYLLTAKPTYDGETMTAKLIAHQSHPIPDLRQQCGDVSDALDAIFKKMLAKKIEDRYQSMSDVISDLERLGAGQATSVSVAPSKSTNANNELTAFFEKNTAATTIKPVPSKIVATGNSGKNKKFALIGAAVLGILVLAGILVSLKTNDGTLIVEVDQPDAIVQVLDDAGKVEIKKKSGKDKITISVDPGKHRLKVEKDGFEFFAQDFQVERGGKKEITARLDVKAAEMHAEDWIGQPKSWKFNQQEITGSTELSGIPLPTYLCSKKTYRNFELSCQVRIISGNTGIQIRSDYLDRDKFKLRGPQVDLGDGFWGSLYGQDFSGMMKAATPDLVARIVKPTDFNDVFVRCVGKRVTIKLNGQTTVDEDFPSIADEGLIGLQLHTGKTEVVFRNIRLKELDHSEQPAKPHPASFANPKSRINNPAFQQWMKDVAAMSADEQVKAVANRLQEINPGFNGSSVASNIGKGAGGKSVVQRLSFHSQDMTDISPVRALVDLKNLFCTGRGGVGSPLADLSPLQGMKLNILNCGTTKVSDLTPLAGMPLTDLACGHTLVSDLSPLKGMKLTSLFCDSTPVANLSPLNGMPLKSLYCDNTLVSDLSPLQGMTLTELSFTPKNVTKGLEVVRQMTSLKIVMTSWNGTKFPSDEFWKKYDAGEFGKPAAPFNDPVKSKSPLPTGGSIDLLKLVDPKQSYNDGEWSKGPNGLTSPGERFVWALIKVPYEVPAEYDWDLKVERVNSKGIALSLQFTTSGHRGAVCIDGFQSSLCALELIDGKNGPTFQGPVLTPGKTNTIRVSVRKNAITVVCDGKEILSWQGDMARFSPYPKWNVPDKQNLFVGSQANFIIHEMSLTPIAVGKP